MNIIIGADVVPNNNVGELFEKGDIKSILGNDLFSIWNNATFKFFNLETPLTEHDIPLLKYGPTIKCKTSVVRGIKKMNPTIVGLANNHIMDYCSDGLYDTLDCLNKNNINWIGVGDNLNMMKKSYVINTTKKIAIYNCCENEFSVATDEICGANPFNPLTVFDDLNQLNKKSDYLIVIYHGGKEYYRYPTPLLQQICRKMIDAGANLVICQHSHCIGCQEEYHKGTIVYGQGNFIFNKRQNEYWNNSLLIDLNIENFEISYIPISQTPNGTRLASCDEKKKILKDFNERSEKIKNSNFINENYNDLCNKEIDNYLVSFYNSLPLRIIKKVFPSALNKHYDFLRILNVIQCEPHRELLVNGLKIKINERVKKNEK